MYISTYRELLYILREYPRIEVVAHRNPAHVGEIRRVTIVQEASFYSVIEGQPEHPVSRRNRGKGSDTWLGNPSCVSFQGDVCTVKNIHDVRMREQNPANYMTFRVLEDR